jgi:hypothetical protein
MSSTIDTLMLVSTVSQQSAYRLIFHSFAFAEGGNEIIDVNFWDTKEKTTVTINTIEEWESKRAQNARLEAAPHA